MILRDALIKTGWEGFQLLPEIDRWDTEEFLEMVPLGGSPEWLDQECEILDEESIRDCHGDILIEVPTPYEADGFPI